jgi:hypothetical protein
MVIMQFSEISFDTEVASGRAILTAAALSQEAHKAEVLRDPKTKDRLIDHWHHFSASHRTRPADNEERVEQERVLLRLQELNQSRSRGRRQQEPVRVIKARRRCKTCGKVHTVIPFAGIMPNSRSRSRDRGRDASGPVEKNRWNHKQKKDQARGLGHRGSPARSSSRTTTRRGRTPPRRSTPPRRRTSTPPPPPPPSPPPTSPPKGEREKPASKHKLVEAPRSDNEAGILPESSRTIIVSEAASGSTVRESSDAKIKYKYGDAFEEAEFISSTPIKRVAQARRYKDVRRNFIGMAAGIISN